MIDFACALCLIRASAPLAHLLTALPEQSHADRRTSDHPDSTSIATVDMSATHTICLLHLKPLQWQRQQLASGTQDKKREMAGVIQATHAAHEARARGLHELAALKAAADRDQAQARSLMF